MYQPDNKVLEPVALSAKTLKKTYFEKQADFNKDDVVDVSVPELLEKQVKVDAKETYIFLTIINHIN